MNVNGVYKLFQIALVTAVLYSTCCLLWWFATKKEPKSFAVGILLVIDGVFLALLILLCGWKFGCEIVSEKTIQSEDHQLLPDKDGYYLYRDSSRRLQEIVYEEDGELKYCHITTFSSDLDRCIEYGCSDPHLIVHRTTVRNVAKWWFLYEPKPSYDLWNGYFIYLPNKEVVKEVSRFRSEVAQKTGALLRPFSLPSS